MNLEIRTSFKVTSLSIFTFQHVSAVPYHDCLHGVHQSSHAGLQQATRLACISVSSFSSTGGRQTFYIKGNTYLLIL